jgi:hypothetical protein
MTAVNRFALQGHDGPYESWPLESRLIADGMPTKTKLPGYTLLHQFETAGAYLLITDYDCPFEERTSFVLLGKSLRVLSCRALGGWFASFLLQDIEWIDGSHFIAVFNGDDRWRLTIRAWGIPLLRPRLKLERCRDAHRRRQ